MKPYFNVSVQPIKLTFDHIIKCLEYRTTSDDKRNTFTLFTASFFLIRKPNFNQIFI